jgi:hypothetical protein
MSSWAARLAGCTLVLLSSQGLAAGLMDAYQAARPERSSLPRGALRAGRRSVRNRYRSRGIVA